MALSLGVFVVPDAQDAERTLAQIDAADATGLDLVGVQDHPYQRRYLDTLTLLSFAAARTRRVRHERSRTQPGGDQRPPGGVGICVRDR